MDKQEIYYPYTGNVKAVKRFFAKPIVLLCAIFGAAYAVGAIVPVFISGTNIVAVSGTDSIAFRVVNLPVGALIFAEAMGLLILFIKSRSHTFSTLKDSFDFLRVISLISAIISAFVLSAASVFFVQTEISAMPDDDSTILLKLLLTACCMAATALCRSIFLFVWLGSARKSVCSVYLRRNGSVPCAVFLIISAAITIALEVFAICDNAYLLNYVRGALEYYQTIMIQISATTAAAIVFYTLLAITAIKYGLYINKYTDKIKIAPETVHTAEKAEIRNPRHAVENKAYGETQTDDIYEKLKDFTPQSVDFSEFDGDDNSGKKKVCSTCGTQCGAWDKFCPRCGTALNN